MERLEKEARGVEGELRACRAAKKEAGEAVRARDKEATALEVGG